jgi:thiosulfate reductase cytochrome b subunit
VLFPAIWISGLAYLFYGAWAHLDTASFWLTIVANIHILAAFAIGSFVVVHVYLLTIGHGFREHVRPMITGFERVEVSPEAEAYFAAERPERLKD